MAADDDTLDLRLALPAAALWVGAWVSPLLGTTGSSVAASALLVVSAAGRRRLPRWVVVATLLAACGAASMALRLSQLHADPFAQWVSEHRQVAVTGVLAADPTFTSRSGFGGSQTQVAARLRVQEVVSGTSQLRLRSPVMVIGDATGWHDLHFADTVEVSGSLRPVAATAPMSALVFTSSPPTEVSGPGPPAAAAESMRSGLRDAVRGLSDDVQGLLPALVVGDTSGMPPLLTSDMQAAGLTHLTAVSGANVAIVVGAAVLLARLLGVRAYALLLVGLVSVAWFVLLARPQPSVLRAAVMGTLALVAVAAAGRAQAARSLLATVAALLLVDPWLARSWGFALSVAATAGLVLLSRRLGDRLPGRVPRPVRDATGVALAAQLATLPLVLALSGQLAVLAVLANVLVTPAVPAATVLGALAATVSPVSAPAASALAWTAQWPTMWITGVARWTAARPLAVVPWPDGWVGGLLGLGSLVVGYAVFRFGRRRGWWRLRSALVLAVVTAAAVVAYSLGPGRWPPAGWVVVACDVGQGDALVVNLGPSTAMVVDAGPDPALADRCLDRLGVRQIPLLVLTHFHADHVDGLPGVLDGRSVGQVLVSPLRSPEAQVDEVERWTSDLRVTTAQPGQTGSWGAASWQVLWPGDLADPGDAEGSAPNNASIVLLVDVAGVRVLLTGDVEPEAQAALVEQGVPTADVLKVPHHGSKYQDPDFLAAVGAEVALVSVGEDNGYGHPDVELLERLRDLGLVVARTDEQGSVAVVSRGGTLRVVSMP